MIAPEWIERVRAEMPELPQAVAERFARDYGLPAYDAAMMTQGRALAAFFETAAQSSGQPKLAANWLMGEVSRRLNAEGRTIESSPLAAPLLGQLVRRIGDGTISNNAAKRVFEALWSGGSSDVDALIESLGLTQQRDAGALAAVVDAVLAANPKSVEEYRAGKAKAFNALVGQAMKATQGKADPAQLGELLKQRLAG